MNIKRTVNKKSVFVFDLEDIALMKDGVEYKMVQLNVNGATKIIFAELKDTHSDLAEAYLSEQGVAYEKVILPKTPEMGPAAMGENYEIIGAGRAQIEGNTLTLKDNSTAYQMGPSVWAQSYKGIIPNNLELKVEGRDELLDQSLEYKLEFLYACLSPNENVKPDEILTKLANISKSDEIEYARIIKAKDLYSNLKIIGEGANTIFNDVYNGKLAEIRDLLLENI